MPYFITFASDGGTIGRKMITMTATPVLPIHDPVFGMEIIWEKFSKTTFVIKFYFSVLSWCITVLCGQMSISNSRTLSSFGLRLQIISNKGNDNNDIWQNRTSLNSQSIKYNIVHNFCHKRLVKFHRLQSQYAGGMQSVIDKFPVNVECRTSCISIFINQIMMSYNKKSHVNRNSKSQEFN